MVSRLWTYKFKQRGKLMKKFLFLMATATGLTVATPQISAVGVGAWVGYNFAAGVDLSACDAGKGTTGECTKGGLAFGGDLWLFGIPAVPIKFGLGAAYVPVSYQKYTATIGSGSGSNSTYTVEIKTKYIPIYAEVRADLMGFFGGVTVGYGISLSDVSTTTTSTSSNIPTASGGAFGVGGFAGYGVGLGPVSIEGGARLFVISGATNIMPFVGAKLEF
jgi:hypothetical protein